MTEEKQGNSSTEINAENDGINLTTTDALSLFSSRLDVALGRHKFQILEEFEDKLRAHEQLTEVGACNKSDFKFKFASNGKEFLFNTSRQGEVKRALVNIKQQGQNSQAVAILEECVSAITERNKIIKIADRHGWDTVDEYVDDPIAESPDDSVRLRQAEARAIRKRKAKGPTGQGKPYSRGGNFQRGGFSGTGSQEAHQLFRGHQQVSGFMGEFPGYGSLPNYAGGLQQVYGGGDFSGCGVQHFRQPSYGTGQSGRNGGGGDPICFYCNGPGQWANNCPRKVKALPSSSQTAPGPKL